jgi:phage FluMu gp28-like protein
MASRARPSEGARRAPLQSGDHTGSPPQKGPAIPLTLYQKRWVEDKSRFKIGRITRQGGKTFGATLEAVLDSYEHVTKWVCLSRGERQSKELIAQCKVHAKAIGVAVEEIEGSFKTDDAEYKMLEIVFPNGSRIIGLPANPDTARGWSANILLDEFALHKDSRAIWRALYPTITRGYKIRIISTPFGKKNKFYELCTADNGYSKHVVPIQVAIKEGLILRDESGKPTTVEELKKGFGDDEGWAQEYEVEFLDEATAFLTYDLIASVENEECETTPEWAKALLDEAKDAYKEFRRTNLEPPLLAKAGVIAQSPLQDSARSGIGPHHLGFDVGRRRDLSVIWLDESKDGVAWTRAVFEMIKQPFFVQKRILFQLLNHPNMKRACIDQTGLGMQIAEEAIEKFGEWKVEGIDFTAASKEALATGLKKNFEDLQSRIPISNTIRNSLHSVKKYETSTGHFRFDADKTEETGHADHFWAKALAAQAASRPAGKIEFRSSGVRRDFTKMEAYL